MQRKFGVFRPMTLKYPHQPSPNLAAWFLLHGKKKEPIPVPLRIFMTVDNEIFMTADSKILMVR